MSGLRRRVYGAIVRLHPADFREEFGRQMMFDLDDAVRERGFAPLLGDAVLSLARQWKACALNGPELAPEIARSVSGHPFLAGQYLMVDRGHLTFFDWSSASLLSLMLVVMVGFSASVPNQRAVAALQTVRVSHDGGIDTGGNRSPSSAADPGHRETRGAAGYLIASGQDNSAAFHGTLVLGRGRALPGWGTHSSGGPQPTITLVHAVRQLVLISIVIWLASLLFRRSSGGPSGAALVLLGLLGIAAGVAYGQASVPQVHAQILHATDPLPSFEVATVKLRDPKAPVVGNRPPGSQSIVRYASPARLLIAIAYNVAANVKQRVLGGPDWIDDHNSTYVIEGKIPDDLYARMQTMSGDERREQACLMLQSLLADRFKLKVHFEQREMPVYELTIAKGGPKLPPANDTGSPAAKPSSTEPPKPSQMGGGEYLAKDGLHIGNMTLDGMLTAPWFGLSDRPIVNQTDLTGTYDLTLNWLPDQAGLASPNGLPAAPDGQASIFTVLQEQLGLRIVATKARVEVVVIDHIERPSAN